MRVVPLGPWESPLPSDTYRVDRDAAVLAVDGFDRVVDGSFGERSHDLVARLAEATGPAESLSHRAIDSPSGRSRPSGTS